MKRIIVLLIGVLFLSCEYFRPKKTGTAVARVGDEYLFEEDIDKLYANDISKEDSTNLAQNFIESWATGKLLVEKAKVNLSAEKLQELEALVNEYQTDIYANAYKEVLIATSIDSVVTNQELESFYIENKDNFVLNEDLVKVRYVSVEKNYEGLKDLKEMVNRFNVEDIEAIQNHSIQFKTYSLNDSAWIRVTEVLKKLPAIEPSEYEKYLKKAQFFELTDSLGVYLVLVKDVLRRNSFAPLEYVKPTVKQIIINKRRLEYNRRLEKELLDEAFQKKHYEIYK